MTKLAILDPYFEECLCCIENIIIETLITDNDQEISCYDTTFGLSGCKIYQILTHLIFFCLFLPLIYTFL